MERTFPLKQQLCSCYRFSLPKLRVGKLDTLVALSDSLQKDDIAVEATLWRLLRQYKEWSDSSVFIPKVEGQNLLDYVVGFRWSEEKFASSESLTNIVQTILEQVHSFEEELKKRTTDYAQRKQITSAEERKTWGSLMVRSLEGLVDPQKCIETEHLTSVFFVVPKYNEKDFLASYEKLASLIVPRSAQRWSQDNDWVLYSITIFRSCIEELKKNAREKRYTIREYSPKSSLTRIHSDHSVEESLESLRLRCLEWITTAFSETAIAWTHLKAIRLFVESVLRFGLPVNVETMLLLPYPKTQSKLLKTLDKITSPWISGNPEYLHHQKSSSTTSDDRYASLLGISIQEELHPFVLLEWNIIGKET
ncbi:V-type H+-transporting ATPase subunit c isoform 1 [Galdieria sulphuraria]|uniref:V-type proton ATPase subunit C n=1 Tax=Galdieria sulphuraria TaxID=130081 RepID=M2XH51_GALSU|nr:V-type H+-transporting ATPase subunit c isoform 1 [Galdieria sulphuraria]EME29392.1 V-type H+-transporting ATPase subunit c isoform 1 [Galdieria sulphuraria]|eukprot:XP_005705912.1 V-type H+-transporting ATPase subunit c isoform 1 [Galdieria sulphuraria]